MNRFDGEDREVLEVARSLVGQVRECLESRDFSALPDVVELDEVKVDGQLMSVEELMRLALGKLSDAEDVWIFALRSQRRELSRQRALMRVTAYIVWSPEGSWEDREHEFDLEIIMERPGRGGWRLSSLEVAPATPEDVPFPEGATSITAAGGSEVPRREPERSR